MYLSYNMSSVVMFNEFDKRRLGLHRGSKLGKFPPMSRCSISSMSVTSWTWKSRFPASNVNNFFGN